jgi:hypothetical protein
MPAPSSEPLKNEPKLIIAKSPCLRPTAGSTVEPASLNQPASCWSRQVSMMSTIRGSVYFTSPLASPL